MKRVGLLLLAALLAAALIGPQMLGAASKGKAPTPASLKVIADTVTFADFTPVPADPNWPGQAPYRTISQGQIVLGCWINVTAAFNDSGGATEIQVTDDPGIVGNHTQLSTSPNPSHVQTTNGAVSVLEQGGEIAGLLPYTPTSGPVTPIVGLNSFVGDGTTGAATVYTLIYTPPS